MINIVIVLFLIIALLVIYWFCFVKNQTTPILKNTTNESFTVAEKNRVSGNLEKLYKQVNPANFYTQNFNTPNFTTDVLDLRKFYDYDLPASKLKTGPEEESGSHQGDMLRRTEADTFPWLEGPDKNKSKNVMESDYWSYKKELPMNGGSFDGMVGYQNMGSSFAFFDQYKEVSEKHPKITDDLRSGMGTPQKEKYLYDMSQI